VDDDSSLVTAFDGIVFEEAGGTVVEFVEVETVFTLDASLTTSFNPRILYLSRPTMHHSSMQPNRTSIPKTSTFASFGTSLFPTHTFFQTIITRHVPVIIAGNHNVP